MSDWMPNLSPDQMRAVMARQPLPPAGLPPGAAPPIGPGGMPVGSATSPGVMPAPGTSSPPAVAPVPRVPAALPVNEQQAQIPRPSDDPGISPEMRKALQPTQNAMSALDAEQKHAVELEGQAAALHRPTTDEYKPPLWKKIAAPFVGALAGRNAEPVVSSMLNGPYNRAVQNFDVQSSALQRQIEAERGINVPLANDRARVAQEGFRNWMEIKKENREQTAFDNEPTGRMPIVRTGDDGQPHYFQKTKGGGEIEVPEPAAITAAHEKENADSNIPAPGARPEPDPANKGQYRVKTKGGGYAPWNPKTVEEGALVGDPRATTLYYREHPGRDTGSGLSPAEDRELTTRQRPLQRQIDQLERDRQLLQKSITEAELYGLNAKGLPAIQAKIDDNLKQQQGLHEKMDAVETEIMGRKTKNQSTSTPGAQPGAQFKIDPRWPQPKSEISVVRDPATKKVFAEAVKGKDGKLTWGPPQPQ